MRYACEDEAFAGDYIEFSDTWSRRQVREAWEAIGPHQADSEAALLAVLRPKTLSVHLTCIDAPPITDPLELTPHRTEEMDTRLYSWLSLVWIRHLRVLADLGNALGRRLFPISAITTPTESDRVSLNHS